MWDYLHRVLNIFYSSYIDTIIHFDVQTNKTVVLYKLQSVLKFLKLHRRIPAHGYFLLILWNKLQRSYNYVLLRDQHLCDALHIDSCSELPRISQADVVHKLDKYIRDPPWYASYKIFDVEVDGIDEYMKLYPVLKSLYVPNNVTPHVIDMVHAWMTDTSYSKRRVVITGCDFVQYDEFLFTS